jgi:hypothetical protein
MNFEFEYIGGEELADIYTIMGIKNEKDLMVNLYSMRSELNYELRIFDTESAVSQVINYIKEVVAVISAKTGYDFYVYYKNFAESNRSFQLHLHKPLHEIINDGAEYFFIEHITNAKNERATERHRLQKDEVIKRTTYIMFDIDINNMELTFYPQTIDLDELEDNE